MDIPGLESCVSVESCVGVRYTTARSCFSLVCTAAVVCVVKQVLVCVCGHGEWVVYAVECCAVIQTTIIL